MQASSPPVIHAALIGLYIVLNVNICILSAVHLEKLKSLLNQVAKVWTLANTLIIRINFILVLGIEICQCRENLTVVGYEGLTDSFAFKDKFLQDDEGGANDFIVTGFQGLLDRYNELWNDGKKYLGVCFLKEFENTLASHECVWFCLFTNALYEDGEV